MEGPEYQMKRSSRRYAYLHGFASSENSYKGVALQSFLHKYGAHLYLPNLNRPSFEHLSYDGALSEMDRLHETTGGDDGPPWCLIGSSMGGYLATRWAELYPHRVDRNFLLCPGFKLVDRWPVLMGKENFCRWELEGKYEFEGPDGTPVEVRWSFVENARTHPGEPQTTVRTRIVHGSADEICPLENSIHYAARDSRVELVTVDDDHGLVKSLPLIQVEVATFFELLGRSMDQPKSV